MDAGGSEGACAGADGHLPLLEVGEEGVPLLLCRDAVLLTGAGGPSASDERSVGLDRLGRVDRLVSDCGVDVLVTADDLGNVRGQSVHDRVGDEDPSKVVGEKDSASPSALVSPVAASALISSFRIAVGVKARCSEPMPR